jgi:hypothetical protein
MLDGLRITHKLKKQIETVMPNSFRHLLKATEQIFIEKQNQKLGSFLNIEPLQSGDAETSSA